jgi:2-polyprenyl-3-methyl-5-hydroxy-6-metoxy-1,4-benzoquinol methylase
MKTPKQFYTEFTPERLAKRKEKKYTEVELKYLKNVLNKKQKILDLACGYGRFTIPLSKEGYQISGIDITPSLIRKAKTESKINNVKIEFMVGDMRKLPHQNGKFDAIICMWNAFCELYREKDQLLVIKEIIRVLKDNGFAFIEVHYSIKGIASTKNKEVKKMLGNRVVLNEVDGIELMPQYLHNKSTFRSLMKKACIKNYKIKVDDFGGRKRLLLQFWKNQ